MYLPHRLNLMPCIINEITISLCPPGITDGFCLEIVAKYQGHQYMWWLCRRIPQQHNTHITIYNRVLVVQFCVTTISLLYVTTILLRNSLLNEKALDYSSRYLLRTTTWFFLKCHWQFTPSECRLLVRIASFYCGRPLLVWSAIGQLTKSVGVACCTSLNCWDI